MILQIIGVIVGIIILYFFIVAFAPGFSVPEQILAKSKKPAGGVGKEPPAARKDVSFPVRGSSISAWLFPPENMSGQVPCIIMANGLGGTKDMILMEQYALRFWKSGFAVLVFDYRCFGDSEGEPRQLIWIPHQLEDWEEAVKYARGLSTIDPNRIALWGTSMSGGHVIVTASKDHRIACISAQCPGLDGRATAEEYFKSQPIRQSLRMLVHGQRDIIRSWIGLSPHMVPIVGKPGTAALMNTADAYDIFGQHAPHDYVNLACARIILRANRYRPVKNARNVRCPVLLQICDHDGITPPSAARETEKNLGKYGEVKHYPIGHFDIYTGSNFERSVSDQLDFFQRHLFNRDASR